MNTNKKHVGRLKYLLLNLIISIPVILLNRNLDSLANMGVAPSLLYIIALILVIVSFAILFGTTISRLREVNQNVWWTLLLLIPGVNFLLVIYLLLAPSQNPITGSII